VRYALAIASKIVARAAPIIIAGAAPIAAIARVAPSSKPPDVPIIGIRLSDWLHREAHNGTRPPAVVPPAVVAATLPAVRCGIPAVLRTALPAIVAARLPAILIVASRLRAIVVARWLAAAALLLARTPLVERASGGIALAGAVIAVMAAPRAGRRWR
jgi:hypothetical protein